MPPDSGLAFIIAAHLDPTQKSHLSELLGPLHQDAGRADRELDQGRARPRLRHRAGSGTDDQRRRRSTRTSRRRRAVTATRSTRSSARWPRIKASARSRSSSPAPAPTAPQGLRFIKAEGGIAMAQDPETAGFTGMPRSAIATGIVDLVLPPEKMAEALLNLARHPYVRQPAEAVVEQTPDESAEYAADARPLAERSRTSAATRSGRCCAGSTAAWACTGSNVSPTTSSACATTRTRSRRWLADLTINVTGFFRDPEAWKRSATKSSRRWCGSVPRIDDPDLGVRAARPGKKPTRSPCLFLSTRKRPKSPSI